MSLTLPAVLERMQKWHFKMRYATVDLIHKQQKPLHACYLQSVDSSHCHVLKQTLKLHGWSCVIPTEEDPVNLGTPSYLLLAA